MTAPESDPPGTDELMRAVYDELQRLASSALGGEAAGFTLQTGDLLHGAYERLQQQRSPWRNAAQFKAIAARHIEHVLKDYVRQRKRKKRGGDWFRISLAGDFAKTDYGTDEFLDLTEALDQLEQLDATQAEIARLRVLGGLSCQEIATERDMALRTVEERWRRARAWLTGRLRDPAR